MIAAVLRLRSVETKAQTWPDCVIETEYKPYIGEYGIGIAIDRAPYGAKFFDREIYIMDNATDFDSIYEIEKTRVLVEKMNNKILSEHYEEIRSGSQHISGYVSRETFSDEWRPEYEN